MYLILKHIDTSNLNDGVDKKFYTNFLRAQLSSDELLFLFYNCASELGNKKFKPLIEKYEIFEHLPKYPCLKGLEEIYDKKAFGESSEWE